MNVLSLFDGISCGRIALEKADIEINNYFASEIDKYAIQISKNNYPELIRLGDVRDIKVLNNSVDLFIGGSPCQDVSKANPNGKGLLGEKSSLFWEYIRLFNEAKPKFFLLENVAMKKEWIDIINKELGVEPIKINSDLFVPQNRVRLYWTNIPILPLPERPNWKEEYYQWRRTYFRKNQSGVCPCLTANMGTGGHNVPLKSENLNDKLTPEECELLQGLPVNYTSGVSNTQRYKMIGNSWTVDVITHIFKGLLLNS